MPKKTPTVEKGKICTKCLIYKPRSDYHKKQSSSTGYDCKCALCGNTYNQERTRAKNLVKKYLKKSPYVAPPKIDRRPLDINRIDKINSLLNQIRHTKPTLNFAQVLVEIRYFQYEIGLNEATLKDPITQDDRYLLERLENYVDTMYL